VREKITQGYRIILTLKILLSVLRTNELSIKYQVTGTLNEWKVKQILQHKAKGRMNLERHLNRWTDQLTKVCRQKMLRDLIHDAKDDDVNLLMQEYIR
jgi:hypothetical protein